MRVMSTVYRGPPLFYLQWVDFGTLEEIQVSTHKISSCTRVQNFFREGFLCPERGTLPVPPSIDPASIRRGPHFVDRPSSIRSGCSTVSGSPFDPERTALHLLRRSRRGGQRRQFLCPRLRNCNCPLSLLRGLMGFRDHHLLVLRIRGSQVGPELSNPREMCQFSEFAPQGIRNRLLPPGKHRSLT